MLQCGAMSSTQWDSSWVVKGVKGKLPSCVNNEGMLWRVEGEEGGVVTAHDAKMKNIRSPMERKTDTFTVTLSWKHTQTNTHTTEQICLKPHWLQAVKVPHPLWLKIACQARTPFLMSFLPLSSPRHLFDDKHCNVLFCSSEKQQTMWRPQNQGWQMHSMNKTSAPVQRERRFSSDV